MVNPVKRIGSDRLQGYGTPALNLEPGYGVDKTAKEEKVREGTGVFRREHGRNCGAWLLQQGVGRERNGSPHQRTYARRRRERWGDGGGGQSQ